jgi:hypothetical protein
VALLWIALPGLATEAPGGGREPGQEAGAGEAAPDPGNEPEDGNRVRLGYEKGLTLTTRDGNYRWHAEIRGQFRYLRSEDEDPVTGERSEGKSGFRIQRARIKMGGHAYRPWMAYYLEYDLVQSWLLDLRFTLQPRESLGLRIGRYKALYNRERVVSSGRQQLAERSIVTPPFTLDRQEGLTLLGRLFPGRAGDSRYAFGLFTGNGRAGGTDEDGSPLLVGRWQWNLLRRDLGFTECDLERREKPVLTLALAGATNRSRYTSFAGEGGGQLPGFRPGEPGQYRIRQGLAEIALMYQGLSLLGEYHRKEIDDSLSGVESDLSGYFVQAGYFLSESFSWFPRPLELALRHAEVEPGEGVYSESSRETQVAANWFFDGHRNKLTLELGPVRRESAEAAAHESWRLRLQWDVSF